MPTPTLGPEAKLTDSQDSLIRLLDSGFTLFAIPDVTPFVGTPEGFVNVEWIEITRLEAMGFIHFYFGNFYLLTEAGKEYVAQLEVPHP